MHYAVLISLFDLPAIIFVISLISIPFTDKNEYL